MEGQGAGSWIDLQIGDGVVERSDSIAAGKTPIGALQQIEMKPGEAIHVSPTTVHRMTAIEDCDVFEVSTPELNDVVRLEDRYGREDKKS